MLRDQLQQQTQQTKQALAQLIIVREQLLSETNARIEAQVSKRCKKYHFIHFQ
jgi:carboxyl-terminal PDZ ligand of neuronal nitric oxide synthase protein